MNDIRFPCYTCGAMALNITLDGNDGICQLCKNKGYLKERVKLRIEYAIESNNCDIVKSFIALHPNALGEIMSNSMYPIHYAAQHNKNNSILALIECGDNIERTDPDEYNHTALYIASDSGSLDCVKILTDNGANVNIQEEFYKYTPLHWAAKWGFLEIAKILIAKGALLNSVDHEGKTPLHLAAESKKKSLIDFLIGIGADISIKNMWGDTYDQ